MVCHGLLLFTTSKEIVVHSKFVNDWKKLCTPVDMDHEQSLILFVGFLQAKIHSNLMKQKLAHICL